MDVKMQVRLPEELRSEFKKTADDNAQVPSLLIRKWIENYIGENSKEEIKMEKLNTTKINGDIYQLPEGYYAVNGRFGDQVYNNHGENVTQKIMGDHNQGGHNPNDYIIETNKGIVKLELVK